ncbi:MAG: hypothetical protein ABI688_00120 [Bacteroidota bacterium]
MTPGCDIDFSRRFSLPFGIAPHELSVDDMGTYLESVDARAELLNNTFDKFTPSSLVNPLKLKKIKSASTDEFTLPFHSSFDSAGAFTSDLPITKTNTKDVIRKAGNLKITQTSEAAIVLELQTKIVFNTVDKDASISAIPVPFHTLDAVRVFWIKESFNPLSTTLGIDTTANANPPYLLETFKNANDFKTGELNRLLIRSPLTGLVRFEPYYHFKWKNNKLETVCPSNSGRLIIKAFRNDLININSQTRLFEENDFIVENSDRESVHSYLFKLLSFNINNFRKFASKKNDSSLDTKLAGVEDLYAIDTSSGLYARYKASVAKALKAWVLFKKNINSNPVDTVSFADIKAGFPKISDLEGDKNTSSAKTLGKFIDKIIGTADWKTGFTDFLEKYYVQLLSGMSWTEVRKRNTQDDNTIKFPVAETEDPKNKTDAASKEKTKEHRVLEGIYNDTLNSILCYSGCPIGLPSKVYDNAVGPVINTIFPTSSLTVYELEAVHLAEKNGIVFPGFTVNASHAPVTGLAPVITDYETKCSGYSSSFELKTKKHFYTFIDFLQDLLKEVNALKLEVPNPILDTSKYYNSTDDTKSHPLLIDILNFPIYKLCESVRDQIAKLNKSNAATTATKLGVANLQWWIDNVDFITDKEIFKVDPITKKIIVDPITKKPIIGIWPDGKSAAPISPFLDSRTRIPPGIGDVPLDDGNAQVSGFDLNDLESLHIARSYVRNYFTAAYDIPLPVILALLQREGTLGFSWLTRIITPKTNRRWKSLGGSFTMPEINDLARIQFLAFPYGLDTYNNHAQTAAGARLKFDEVITELTAIGIETIDPLKFTKLTDVRESITERVLGVSGPVLIQKLNKRVHWQFIVLMLGWFQYRHKRMKENGQSIHELGPFTSTDAAWFTNDYSTEQKTVDALHLKRKDFITYYSLLYLGYNASPEIWSNFVSLVENASRGGLSLRDFLVFKFTVPAAAANRDKKLTAMSNMIHFAASLDAFSRLIYDETTVTLFDDSNPDARLWGV